jgi:prevent-host-death family protein
MKTMGAGAFKTHCLSVIDEVYDRNEEIIITKRGKPMAKLVPMAGIRRESVFNLWKDKVKIVGDIVSPITEPWEWDEDVFPQGTPEREALERNKKRSAATAAAKSAARRRK